MKATPTTAALLALALAGGCAMGQKPEDLAHVLTCDDLSNERAKVERMIDGLESGKVTQRYGQPNAHVLRNRTLPLISEAMEIKGC